ncbi:MAG: hypothetical protein QF701_15495 [Nitrospinota bacterium]|jgi:hypothetical protein|nr:hypothetical protein [Nitrospinota bacterium]MDP6277596.1 hypothetical protein [Nitrospinota bacterium]MDP6366059.1 hypothetical protein [Nitrospinota bacterium]MDP7169133.1 hypothetical protein [Nitrospinota bacterium]MDP7369099.1 hypothetical protein [Nitrospinota bacterium]
MSEDLSAPGQSLFPDYTRIAGMYEREVEGLSGEQIDTLQPEKSWGQWSIRNQVSHAASVQYRHFLGNWGEALFGGNLPRDKSLIDTGGADRILDPGRFHEMPVLLAALKDGADLVWEILAGETLGSMRARTQSRTIKADERFASGDSRMAYTENLTLKAHPGAYWRDEGDPELFHYTLEFTFRHVLWEGFAHLRTIQAHKQAMGLPAVNDLPEEGYLKYIMWE